MSESISTWAAAVESFNHIQSEVRPDRDAETWVQSLLTTHYLNVIMKMTPEQYGLIIAVNLLDGTTVEKTIKDKVLVEAGNASGDQGLSEGYEHGVNPPTKLFPSKTGMSGTVRDFLIGTHPNGVKSVQLRIVE